MYQFTTFTNKISFYNYINSLSNNEMEQKIKLLYGTVKGTCGKDLRLGGLIGVRYANLLLLFDYCNKCLPFDNQKYSGAALQISYILSFLFCVIPCEHESFFEDKVLTILNDLIQSLQRNSITTLAEFNRAKDVVDEKMATKYLGFCDKWTSYPTNIELQIKNTYNNCVNEIDCFAKIGLGLFER